MVLRVLPAETPRRAQLLLARGKGFVSSVTRKTDNVAYNLILSFSGMTRLGISSDVEARSGHGSRIRLQN
jgi:hypothetical protein